MEGRDSMSGGGVTVVGSDAPSDYHVAPRTENSNQTAGSAPPPAAAPQPLALSAVVTDSTIPAKKKRGRPRKYGPDGSVSIALSPKPISSSAPPPVIDFSSAKRGKVKPANSVHKNKYEVENLGEWVACSVGAHFTPHIITVNSGEDVTMKIISFSQQGPRAICILSANGVISSVTLRQPDSSGGTLTYEAASASPKTHSKEAAAIEGKNLRRSKLQAVIKYIIQLFNYKKGRFEILSLSGSFMPSDSGGTRSRSGGMSVSLSSPDGRVVGGGVAGLLVAASPVQVVVGSFLTGNQHEQKTKKPRHDSISTIATAAIPISSADPRTNLSSSSSFRGDSWSAVPSDSRNNKPTDINVSLQGL